MKLDTISLLIMLLNALEVDQTNAIKKMHAEVSPYILNAETMEDNAKLLSKIKLSMHTHVLTCPELALLNESVWEVFQTPGFRDRLVLIAINEVHLVKDWASWQSDYGRLGELQSILPRSVPFLPHRRPWVTNWQKSLSSIWDSMPMWRSSKNLSIKKICSSTFGCCTLLPQTALKISGFWPLLLAHCQKSSSMETRSPFW